MKKYYFLLAFLMACSSSQDATTESKDTTTTIPDTTTTESKDTTTTIPDTTTTESKDTTTTVQDTTTTTVQDSTTTTVQDTTSEVDECSKKTSPDKCHYVAVGYDKPQNEFAQEIVVATDVPQTIVDEYYEIQNMLNSIIGSYNRYVTVITTTNEFSQPIFDKLTEIHWDQELNIVDGYLIGAGCLTGSGDWQVFPPDPYALCIMDYEFVEYPHETREWKTPLPKRRLVLYHGWAHEYFHRYQRAYHYELNMGNLDSIDTPVWWIEGAAILFPNIWLNQSWQEIELFKDLSFQEIQEAEGVNLELWYKSARKAAQGESHPDDRCNDYMMNSLDSSYDTSAFCFIGIANAYLAYLTSYETVWVDIPKDIYELSFQGSFEKHTNMT
ncbi:MAG: hypothetical protein ISP22_05410, partial [Candidatus Actinomarina sp.]|nr:hypothetical protein [Candidatus Actinomarina sp.]